MENKENYEKQIEQLLARQGTADELQNLCRNIACEALNRLYGIPEEKKRADLRLCREYHFHIREKAGAAPAASSPSFLQYAGVVAAVTGMALLTYWDVSIGKACLTGLVIGIVVHYLSTGRQTPAEHRTKEHGQIETTANELVRQIETLLSVLETLVRTEPTEDEETYPLDGKYRDILAFLNNSYMDCLGFGEECALFFRKQIKKILAVSGYELLDYSPEEADRFDTDYANGIDRPDIAEYAIRNKKTDRTVVKGKVFLPNGKQE